MVLEKMASEVLDQCILEINKNDNIEKVKNKLLKPCFEHIYNYYFHRYIILFYVSLVFLFLTIIIILFFILKIFNKVASLDIYKA